MAVKNANAKTWTKGVHTTLGSGGRYYSDPSKVPASVVNAVLRYGTM